jgi:flagellar biogenesis protein FliO
LQAANKKRGRGREMKGNEDARTMLVGGVTGWLLSRLRTGGGGRVRPRLALVERITLAPRQSLALVEAEGRRFLVATSPEGAPAFYALDEAGRLSAAQTKGAARPEARVSW